ncbi:MAG TPA: hypothetical protein GXX70_01370 [Tepidimicrobium sp.]|nr:hypothetical protein [Tepidimicrobium sp.]
MGAFINYSRFTSITGNIIRSKSQ